MTGQQLKNSILQLTIQGKLVPQDPNDEPASVLLQRIRKEKEQLVKEGKLKKKDLISEPITEDEKPFDIPESWEWCRLGEVITMLSGQDFAPSGYNDLHDGIPYITGASNLKDRKLIVNRWTSNPTIKASYGDLLVVCKGSGVGKMAYCTEQEVHIARQIQCIKNSFNAIHLGYIEGCITYFLEEVVSQANGLIPGISRDVLLLHVLPLPPLSEQQRIVAKIEELMPLVEDYDKAQKELNDLNEKLPEQLKKSILQQAIMGKLVPQDPADEPASVLLQRIRKEKEQLVKEGKLKKKDLETTPIADDEKPFDIPESWEWVRISELSIVVTKGTTPRGGNIAYVDSGIGFLRAENVAGMDVLDLTNLKYVTETTHHTFLSRSVLHARDILITIAGTLGRTAIVKLENLPLNANQAVCLIRPLKVVQNLRYIITALNAPIIQDSLLGFTKTTAIPNLTLEIISNCVLPLPPLAEQQRIVSKIEELFAQLDEIEKSLN